MCSSLGVVVGALFTGLIQSSAASVGILQALSLTGSITYAMAIPIVMGQNIGTCVTSMISSIGTNKNAKRVAFIHIAVNCIGTVILLIILGLVNMFFDIAVADMPVSPVSIAMIHTIFNVAITVMLMPCGKLIEKLAVLAVPDKKGEKERRPHAAPFLDARLLSTPSVAIAECENKTLEMANLSKQTIFDAIALFGHYTDEDAQQIRADEDVIDLYEDKLGSYLVQLSGKDLSGPDTRKVAKMLHSIGDFERLGDHALNLKDAAQEIHRKGLKFSDNAMQELDVLTLALTETLTQTMKAFASGDLVEAAKVEPLEQVMDDLIETVKVHHVERLQAGKCTIELGFVLSDILTNYERISDHCSNIAVCIIETQHDSFDTHEYLHTIKKDAAFEDQYRTYPEKYHLPEVAF